MFIYTSVRHIRSCTFQNLFPLAKTIDLKDVILLQIEKYKIQYAKFRNKKKLEIIQ